MDLKLGPAIGLNLGNIQFSPTPVYPSGVEQNERIGIMFGARAEVGFDTLIHIIIQPTYARDGYRLTGPAGTATVSIDEIEFPMLLKFRFLEGSVHPYVFAGPNFSLVVSAKESYDIAGQIVPDQDLKSQTYSTNLAIDLGIGLEFNLGPNLDIAADVRYSLGVANVLMLPTSDVPDGTSASTTRASDMQFLFCVMFRTP